MKLGHGPHSIWNALQQCYLMVRYIAHAKGNASSKIKHTRAQVPYGGAVLLGDVVHLDRAGWHLV